MLLEQISDFELRDLNGDTVSIQDFRGTNTLLFMWASW
ncbi:peroxiredoxin family protein [Salibacterium sp. K-3]